MKKVVTEFHCHNCDGWIKIALDYDKDGNHVIECPKCKHEHCRVIKNGKITSDRWESRNDTIQYSVNMNNYYNSSTSSNDYFLAGSWNNTSSSRVAYY